MFACKNSVLPLVSTQPLLSHCRTTIYHFSMTLCLANCVRLLEDKVKEVKVGIILIEK